MAVRIIGDGYYGIVAENVSEDRTATARIDRAFEKAKSVPSERLNIRPTSSGDAASPASRKPHSK
jgi:hypothetical protein